jgi:(1->4)-alpha-D-glucan 1-alpha-D-glucosylmutase
MLDPGRASLFLADFTDFAARVAWLGMLNGLSQALLKMTLPGVPDIYQGAELWDYDMVDPDNRRPVDFDLRIGPLADLRRRFGGGVADRAAMRELLDDWTDGRIKLLVLSKLLRLRRERSGLFREGSYVPLKVTGVHAEHVCAFARVEGANPLVVAVPRLMATVSRGPAEPPLGERWAETAIVCPSTLSAESWTNVLSGDIVRTEPVGDDTLLPLRKLFADLPVAALLAGTVLPASEPGA